MQSIRYPAHSLTKHRFAEFEQIVEENLCHNWVLRVEHTETVDPCYPQWQQWGKTLFAVKDSMSLIESIVACRENHPTHSIRLCAEKTNPQVRFVYWVYRSEYEAESATHAEQSAIPETKYVVNWLLLLHDIVRAARSRIWKIITIAGMLLASLLLFEELTA